MSFDLPSLAVAGALVGGAVVFALIRRWMDDFR